jgi:site-specific DNA recombinase
MQAVGYIRVSTADQAESGLSLAHQESKIRAYCAALDIELAEIYTDAGYSAKSLNRPAMQEVIQQIKSGVVNTVVILKLDRLTRSVKDLGAVVELFDKTGAALISVQDSINTTTAAGRLVLNVLGSVAQWEREAIAERTKAALQVKRQQGKRAGEIPFGYVLDVDGETLLPDSGEQEAIRLMLSLRAGGMPLRKIISELERRGISTKKGGAWHAQTVANICQAASAS